ncbi:uncharacterized protein [Littorina saxatilis]|uniref:uncharacterized protein n=1 Tax=Littorina saxatilis TaxID=31220 RepID=UPI0038B5798F
MGGWKLISLALALIVSLATSTNAATDIAVEDAPAAANCTADDGSVIPHGKDKLYPAETSCTILRCTDHGLDRLVAECEAPRCVQPRRKPGACCLTCPDGFNCLLPTGEILDASSAFTIDTTRCVCPTITTGLGWDQDLALAVCQPVTTTPAPTTPPPPSCLLSDGTEIGEGEVSVVGREDGGCTRQECEEGGRLVVKYGDCPAVECPEPVRRPGACCRTCPDDPDMASEPETYMTSPAPVTRSLKVYSMSLGTLLQMIFGAIFGARRNPPGSGRPPRPHHGPKHHPGHHDQQAPESPMAEGESEPKGNGYPRRPPRHHGKYHGHHAKKDQESPIAEGESEPEGNGYPRRPPHHHGKYHGRRRGSQGSSTAEGEAEPEGNGDDGSLRENDGRRAGYDGSPDGNAGSPDEYDGSAHASHGKKRPCHKRRGWGGQFP